MNSAQLHLTLGQGKPTPSSGKDEALYLTENPRFAHLCVPSRAPKHVDAPFERTISAGKNTYVYDAHTYHTKVPPQGIRTLIEHYTNPGDVVLDPFCGSGMTGVAATSSGRAAMLSDLSPAAVFIAYNLNTPIDQDVYLDAIRDVLEKCKAAEKELYTTHCRMCSKPVPMLYTVWSYSLVCKNCTAAFVLWDVARDERPNVRESKILASFECPQCKQTIQKRGLKREGRVPVSIGYRCCQSGLKESTAVPNAFDLALLARLDADRPTDWYPTDPFPDGVNTKQPIAAGITSVDKAYTPRALRAMSLLWSIASDWPDARIKDKLLFTVTSLYQRVTLFSEFRFWGGSGNTANYNVPAIINEQNVFATFERKAKTISWYFREAAARPREIAVSTQSATQLKQVKDLSVDYVFTDPPFGANINYSEMNFLWESWLRVKTNNENEAIVNRVQGKDYKAYQALLTASFGEIRRVLKNDAWLTVVFHNSSEDAWTCVQSSLYDAGFHIEGTQTFDKQHGTFKMFVSDNAVGYDLVLHCRKAVRRMDRGALGGSREDASSFVRAIDLSTESLMVRYQHVQRADELNYRKLYSDWLSDAIPRGLYSLSFEEFRLIVNERIGELKFARIV